MSLDGTLNSTIVSSLNTTPASALNRSVDSININSTSSPLDGRLDNSIDEIANYQSDYYFDDVNNKIDDHIDRPLVNKIDSQIDNQLNKSINSTIERKIDNKLINQIDNEIVSKIDNKIDSKIDSKVVSALPTKQTPKSLIKKSTNKSSNKLSTSASRRSVSFTPLDPQTTSPDIHIDREIDSEVDRQVEEQIDSRYTTPYSEVAISTPGSRDFPRGLALQDDSFELDETDLQDTDEEDLNESSIMPDDSFIQSLKKKSSTMEEDDSDYSIDESSRRSKRVTRGKRFEYWKNERPVYDQGEMVGLLLALPTPKKSNKTRANSKQQTSKTKLIKLADKQIDKQIDRRLDSQSDDRPVKIPRNIKILNKDESEELLIWNESEKDIQTLKCVSRFDKSPTLLPLQATQQRRKGHEEVAYAAQLFSQSDPENLRSSWLAGFLELPPGAIKDAENVQSYTQVFFVSSGQRESLELGIADPRETDWTDSLAQRVLLGPGDSFFIPPGNIYRLENHSEDRKCVINWVIIKPIAESE